MLRKHLDLKKVCTLTRFNCLQNGNTIRKSTVGNICTERNHYTAVRGTDLFSVCMRSLKESI